MLFCSITHSECVPGPDKDIAFELRLDLFSRIDLKQIDHLLKTAIRPVMLTLRSAAQGGKFQGTESQRKTLIQQLLSLNPPFFDLEYSLEKEFIHEMLKRYPKTKFILSYHNFQQTPPDLETVYSTLKMFPSAYSYKIAAITHSTNDALKMLLFAKKHPKVSAICMGEAGGFARILGPIVGNQVDFACMRWEEQTAPGQLSVTELLNIYRYPSLNPNSAIFGLIGDPVENSPGHLHHNSLFQQLGFNAVYVKMKVASNELEEFIPLAKALGIKGLSVTAPLKEKILPFIDETDLMTKSIGAANTLLFHHGQILGTNTDGLGALDAIEKKLPIRGKKMVLIGAGGAARSIAFEALNRGARVLILNRTIERAKNLAETMGCAAGSLDQMPNDYDIFINCTTESQPIDPEKIKPRTFVMDIIHSPAETPFLKEASLRDCQIIFGKEMFLNQASRQTAFWMDQPLCRPN